MKNTKLIRILNTFSHTEIKEFEKFINSPFFGCKRFVANFFKEIKKYYPEFEEGDIDRIKIFSQLYGTKDYNDGLVRRMTSDLIGLAEEYLTYTCLRDTPSFRDCCFLHELRVRKLNEIFENKSSNILSDISKQNIDSNVILQKFFVENQRINYFIKGNDKKLKEALASGSNTLISFFLSALNNKTQNIHSRKHNPEEKKDLYLYDSFISHFNYDEFIKSLEKFENKESYFIMVNYYSNLLTMDKNDLDSYNKLKLLIHNNQNYFSGVFKYNYLITLAGICAGQIQNNNYEYIDEYFFNIEIILKEKLFLANSSIISPLLIRNIIMFSLMQKNYSYAEDFIKTYSKYFPPDKKNDFINYCNALLMFSKGKTDRALEFSSLTDIRQTEFNKDIRILKIKSFYELGYFDSFETELDSFKHFLHNEESIAESSKLKANNFIKYISRLYKLKNEFSRKEFSFFKKELQNENEISEKLWLLEKAGEMT